RTVSIDFLMHGETPGPIWARSAKPGDTIEIKGPRGRTVFDETAAWHLMACDETGIPAIAHIIEDAPEGCIIHAYIEIDTAADHFDIETAADLHLTWVERNGKAPGPSTLMADTLAGFTLPEGRGKAYLAG